ncbi:hypothetical protein [Puia dinghuensis]|uniref:Uncharacterized protein n=1 Tax=Puia dinghuensis TaxID=1792502 RepID=A0A8J2XVV3_9BACT|nr:hypothetical protein [Puia dinghuensis]GGB14532.1 hypothetical protein GCM10011511_42970 [Puia dinghuensis]
MKHLHDDFTSQYIDRRGQKYTVYGNFTSLPADGSELGRDADMIYVKFHKVEETEATFMNKPEDGEIYIRLIDLNWTPGIYRNQRFVPSATAFNTWLQQIILQDYQLLEARSEV